jgi:lipoyl(octanoyl) transferase
MGQATAISESVEWHVSPGLTPYQTALDTMGARVTGIREGSMSEQVWLVEHPPLYTAGTSAKPQDLHAAGAFPVFQAGRGGQWTYHGPGQRVAYVMLDLTKTHGRIPARDVRQFVWGLEEWLIRTLAAFDVRGERREGRVGIWVADPATGAEAKIGAIGVRVTRWVSWHGISLNVAPDLAHFAGIVPCGISQHGVTSLEALGRDVRIEEVDAAIRINFATVFEKI